MPPTAGWESLLVAEAGVAAVLAGLLFGEAVGGQQHDPGPLGGPLGVVRH
jgi:hypothetical protein